MPRPLTHTGESVNGMIHDKRRVTGMIVYIGGAPQVMGIIRDVELDPKGYWVNRVLIEWQSGRKVWRHAGSVMTVDSKIMEEERVLNTLIVARTAAKRHFGVYDAKG